MATGMVAIESFVLRPGAGANTPRSGQAPRVGRCPAAPGQ